MVTLPLVDQLADVRCQVPQGSDLKPNLDDRMKQTASWSSWAPGFKQAVKTSLLILCRDHGFEGVAIQKVLNAEQWKQHILQGHVPYRRDCRACILDMASGKPHKRRTWGGSSSWSMSVDVVPMVSTVDVSTGCKAKYMMVATVVVPKFESLEQSRSLEVPESHPKDYDWGEGLDESQFALGFDEGVAKVGSVPPSGERNVAEDQPPPSGVQQVDESQFAFGHDEGVERVGSEPPSGERNGVEDQPPPSGVQHVDPIAVAQDVCSAPLSVQHVTLMEPVESRHVSHVIRALNQLHTRYKYLGICVTRVHSDRAKELISRLVQKWLASKGLVQTLTSGDDASSNGRVESEIHQIKRRVRLLLRQSSRPVTDWPIAARYATEQRLRQQLRLLGCPTLSMIPFDAPVLVKRKRWHDRGVLASPFVEGKLLCASPVMTCGWLVETNQHQIVHVREAIVPAPLGEQVALQLQESHVAPRQMVEEPDPGRPRYRAVGKQADPHQPKYVLPAEVPGLKDPQPFSEAIEPSRADLDVEYSPSIAPEENPQDFVPELDSGGEGLGVSTVWGDDHDDGSRRGEEGFQNSVNPLKIAAICGNENPNAVDESAMVRRVSIDELQLVMKNIHQGLLDQLQDVLDGVPIGCDQGKQYGKMIEGIQNDREYVETMLTELDRLSNDHVHRLCSAQAGSSAPSNVHLGENGEVLQTVTVSLEEVRKDLPGWHQAMLNEYVSLTGETKAIEPIDVSTLQDQDVEYVPGKLVCTIKAGPNGGRRKCRSVICGNLLEESADPVPGTAYASGADASLTRATLQHAVQRGWGASITDVKTAFLLAPRPVPESGREAIVIPPKILVAAGICQPNERWRVHKALYGFQSSPARWAKHRDSTMKGFEWWLGDHRFSMQHTPEVNLWRIHKWDPQGNNHECVGHVLVYVDDLMVVASQEVRLGFLERLQKEWNVSQPEHVHENGWVRFAGLEVRWNGDSLRIAQPSYTQELLDRYQPPGKRSSPMPKLEPPEGDEPGVTAALIKQAQGLTGELLWLVVRTRPDLSYSVGMMGRNLSRNPSWSLQVGQSVLEYLAETPYQGLVYRPCTPDHGPQNHLPFLRHEKLVETYTDVSFAPQGGRSCQAIVTLYAGAPVMWESVRQPFATLSTAESELVGTCEGMVMTQSIEALLRVIYDQDGFEKILVGDNLSAISIINKPDGPWRTRHLRLRAVCLKEKLQSPQQDWKVIHQRGTELCADCLTKPIVSQSVWLQFWKALSMETPPSEQGSPQVAVLATKETKGCDPTHLGLLVRLLQMLGRCQQLAADGRRALLLVASILALWGGRSWCVRDEPSVDVQARIGEHDPGASPEVETEVNSIAEPVQADCDSWNIQARVARLGVGQAVHAVCSDKPAVDCRAVSILSVQTGSEVNLRMTRKIKKPEEQCQELQAKESNKKCQHDEMKGWLRDHEPDHQRCQVGRLSSSIVPSFKEEQEGEEQEGKHTVYKLAALRSAEASVRPYLSPSGSPNLETSSPSAMADVDVSVCDMFMQPPRGAKVASAGGAQSPARSDQPVIAPKASAAERCYGRVNSAQNRGRIAMGSMKVRPTMYQPDVWDVISQGDLDVGQTAAGSMEVRPPMYQQEVWDVISEGDLDVGQTAVRSMEVRPRCTSRMCGVSFRTVTSMWPRRSSESWRNQNFECFPDGKGGVWERQRVPHPS